jgi:spermidine synthase
MTTNSEWFTEFSPTNGIGVGIKIKSRLHHEKTPFQTISIYETALFGNLMVIDDVVMLTSRDNFLYHEMMSHPALFSHPAPKNVVIIGGGDCGTLKEVLKHPVLSVKQIEIDERVTRLAEIYFPELCSANHDKRAELLFQDGIHWMQNAPSNSVDVIIVDSTDPIGPAVGLFNQAFYEQCHRVLTPEGILVQQSESPLLHQSILQQMRQAMKNAGFPHLLTLSYPQPVYPAGWMSATLAGKRPLSDIRKDSTLFSQLKTQYYTFPLHEGLLTELPLLRNLFNNQ